MYDFGVFGHNLDQIMPNFSNFDPVMIKFQNFMINSYLVLESMWESGLVWRPRPPNKVLDLWANFGPLRAKISQIAWGTPTFYCTPRLYLPIGIQK